MSVLHFAHRNDVHYCERKKRNNKRQLQMDNEPATNGIFFTHTCTCPTPFWQSIICCVVKLRSKRRWALSILWISKCQQPTSWPMPLLTTASVISKVVGILIFTKWSVPNALWNVAQQDSKVPIVKRALGTNHFVNIKMPTTYKLTKLHPSAMAFWMSKNMLLPTPFGTNKQ